MGALGLSAAIGLELLATVGLVFLAARVYERAILRTGAPVRLRALLRDDPHGHRPRPVESADPRLRLGVAAVRAGGAFILTGGAGAIEISLVATGLLLIAFYKWGRRNAPEPFR